MSYNVMNPTWPNAEDKKRREEFFYLVCYYSDKIKNHVVNWETYRRKNNSCYDIKCEICSKLLCFLDCINNEEKRIGNEIDMEKMQKMGTTENMIFGDGIKLLE